MPLRVLYLAPPSPRGRALAAQSFIEEEIQGIRAWQVMPFILTDELREDTVRDGVAVVGLPRLSIVSAVPLLAFALRHAGVVGRILRASWNIRRVLHALRLEHAAASIVRRERIDLVHSHFGWPAGFGGSLAVATTGTPLVTSIRGTDVLIREDLGYGLRRDKGYDVALRHLFTKARRVLTATGFMRRTTEALGAPARTLRVLDKGVDAETFMPPADREAVKRALRLSGPVVLAVGSLKRRKGFEAIIDALAPLKAEPWTLVICGSGEEHAALERRAADAGIASRTVFAGHVSRADIPTWFAAADVFVHAAELEAAGNVVLEALAAGCAVVCTDSGGPGEYVRSGENGLVVPVGDVAALREALATVLGDPALRQRFAREGRRRIEASHTYPRMMRELRAIYDEVVGPGRAAAPLSRREVAAQVGEERVDGGGVAEHVSRHEPEDRVVDLAVLGDRQPRARAGRRQHVGPGAAEGE